MMIRVSGAKIGNLGGIKKFLKKVKKLFYIFAIKFDSNFG